jgi:serine/threonine protein kinase
MDDLRRSSSNLKNNRSLTPVLMETPGVTPGLLGDFQILRELGRGGMGVVYEARQVSLNRRVALKVLPLAAAMDSRQLQRFHVEAQAAACLHHTNIVPIHAVGCERGVHYYAMQYIEGLTLAAVIRDLRMTEGLDTPNGPEAEATALLPSPLAGEAESPGCAGGGPQGRMRGPLADAPAARKEPRTPVATSIRDRAFFRSVANMGIQAAEALEHAHGLGVIHRDIKPANLIVDDRGTLWITDFGLARLQNDSGLTITGDLMGTLRYMSPEQALGNRIILDHRTDIYSLGVTLYELLTIRPAFSGEDRQAVLRKIAEEEPIAPRRLNESIPRELETIVLKAMSKEPESRYATALELADDLRRFLESKPIRARRPNVLELATKWVRRHQAIVGLAATVLLLASLGLTVALARIAREQEKTRAALVRAEARSRVARRAVDQMYTRFAERWLGEQPHLTPIQREFLEEALHSYEDLAREPGSDPAAREGLAEAYRRVGEIRAALGRHREAEDSFQRALAAWEGLQTEAPERAEYGLQLAAVSSRLGNLLRETGRFDEAQATYRRALALAEGPAQQPGARPDSIRLVANCRENQAFLQAQIGRYAEAKAGYVRALDDYERLVARHPDRPEFLKNLANCQNNLGNLLRALGAFSEAEAAYRSALTAAESLAKQERSSPSYRSYPPFIRLNMATVFDQTGRLREAEDALRGALGEHESLAADFPDIPEFRDLLAANLNNLADALRGRGRSTEAGPLYRRAVALGQELAAAHSQSPDYRARLSIYTDNLANWFRDSGQPDEAEATYRRARTTAEALVEQFPGTPSYEEQLADILGDFTVFLTERRRYPEAEAASRRAIAIAESSHADHRGQAGARNRLATYNVQLGDVLQAAGRPREAERTFREVAALYGQEDTHLEVPDLRILAKVWGNLAKLLKASGRDAEASSCYGRALEIMDRLQSRAPDIAELRRDSTSLRNEFAWLLATSTAPDVRDPSRAVELAEEAVKVAPREGGFWNTLGLARYRVGDWKGAIAALQESMKLRSGGDANDWIILAMALRQAGDKDQAQLWYDKATGWMEQNTPKNPELLRLRAEAAAVLGRSDAPKPVQKEMNHSK